MFVPSSTQPTAIPPSRSEQPYTFPFAGLLPNEVAVEFAVGSQITRVETRSLESALVALTDAVQVETDEGRLEELRTAIHHWVHVDEELGPDAQLVSVWMVKPEDVDEDDDDDETLVEEDGEKVADEEDAEEEKKKEEEEEEEEEEEVPGQKRDIRQAMQRLSVTLRKYLEELEGQEGDHDIMNRFWKDASPDWMIIEKIWWELLSEYRRVEFGNDALEKKDEDSGMDAKEDVENREKKVSGKDKIKD